MTAGPLLFGVLVAFGVLIAFGAVWRLAGTQGAVEVRLQQYGGMPPAEAEIDEYLPRRVEWSGAGRLLNGFGLGPRLALALARADLPITAAEFTMIVLGMAALGFLFGFWRLGLASGVMLGAVLAYLPIFYLRVMQQRRRRALTQQLPDMLTLLVGALRAGYGLSQSLEVIVEQLSPPIATELTRVIRAVSLGVPVQRALREMVERVDIEDMEMVVTAINIQYETGGNLAQTLEIISETVRDRLRIQREIRTLTAQQRLTGYILGALPVTLALILYILNPSYISRLFSPGWIRIVPITAGLMQLAGFLVIRRIVDIEV
ncbi:MAG TPA: secretion system protein [Caldilineae bacterium]|nr:secretion system protein [Caldilineae bacterium]